MKPVFPVLLTGLIGLSVLSSLVLSSPVLAAELTVKVGIPRLTVAEYHRPYVAVWLESGAGEATSLAVWYDKDKKNNEGTKWLKDLRQWWRKSGRELTPPLDGLSGATRPVGEHSLTFTSQQAPLKTLPSGHYRLLVEAAREGGGRELLQIPLVWPPKQAQQLQAQGQSELGALLLDLKP